jgi:hypothetical protein
MGKHSQASASRQRRFKAADALVSHYYAERRWASMWTHDDTAFPIVRVGSLAKPTPSKGRNGRAKVVPMA